MNALSKEVKDNSFKFESLMGMLIYHLLYVNK